MGLWDRFSGWFGLPYDTFDAAQRVLPEPYEPFRGLPFPVADPGVPLPELYRGNVDALWRSQPTVRKVVDFIARNVASIPLHAFERVSDTDRVRLHGHVLADVLASPAPRSAPYRFWHGVISDGLLYDRWALLKRPTDDGGLELIQVPSWRLRFEVDAFRRVTAAWYWVGEATQQRGDVDGYRPLPLDELIFDHGYAPKSAGLSPLETLRDLLAESAEAVRYRRQVWQNGARVPAWIERPPPVAGEDWSPQARQRFADGFRAAYTGDGENAGGVPLLEDGMKLHALDAFTPQDAMDLEGRRLTAIEVAAAYHIAPELVGAQQGNYSNVREFRQMLYRDSLGPYIAAWEGVLNAQLVPGLAEGRPLYVEANVEAKLRGSFEEQAQMMSSAIGAPWLTRNEGRALMNRPALDGLDETVVPLNVLVGGQSSPRDSGSQNLASRGVRVKSRAPKTYTSKIEQTLSAFFRRQGKVVKSRLGAKADEEWWDEPRWNAELSDDLFALAMTVTQQVAKSTLDSLGVEPDRYDPDRTVKFLRAVSDRVAGQINSTTKRQIDEVLEADGPQAVADVFATAEDSRSEMAALSLTTMLSGFATTEAATQVTGGRATKTWVTQSGNPRSSHAALDGETVPLDETFSNGAMWPGDGVLDVDETAGCQCDLVVNLP